MTLIEEQYRMAWRREINGTPRKPQGTPRLDALTVRVEMLEARLEKFATQVEDRAAVQPRPARITKRMIMDAVCHTFGATVLDLASARKDARVAHVRQVAAYLMRHLTTQSMPQIGDELGGRDHTTIMHGVRKIHVQRQINPDLDATLKEIEAGLRASVKP